MKLLLALFLFTSQAMALPMVQPDVPHFKMAPDAGASVDDETAPTYDTAVSEYNAELTANGGKARMLSQRTSDWHDELIRCRGLEKQAQMDCTKAMTAQQNCDLARYQAGIGFNRGQWNLYWKPRYRKGKAAGCT